MKQVSLGEEEEKQAFVKEAAAYFAKNEKKWSYAAGNIVAGCYFALRWGMDDNSVLLFKLDENLEPVIYGQAVREAMQ